MNEISTEIVPVLPIKGVFCEECVAMGVFEDGVIVSLLEKDKAVVVAWDDIVDIVKKHIEAGKDTVDPGATREITNPD